MAQGRSNQLQQSSTLSTVDKAFLAQQASQEFARIFTEIHNIYTQQLAQLSSSGAMGAGGIEANAQLRNATTSALYIQGTSTLAGLAATAIPGFGPVFGAGIAGLGSIYSSRMAQEAQVDYIQDMNVSHAKLMSSMVSAINGTSPWGVYNAFMSGLSPERYGVGLERLAGYAGVDIGPVPYGIENYNQLVRNSMTEFAPEGNPALVDRRAQAFSQLAALNYRSLGVSPQDFVNRGRTRSTPSESVADFDQRLKTGKVPLSDDEMRELFRNTSFADTSTNVPDVFDLNFRAFKEAIKNGIDPSGRVRAQAWGGAGSLLTDTWQISSNAMSTLQNRRRIQAKTETFFSDEDILENFVNGGPQAVAAMRVIASDSAGFDTQAARVLQGIGQDYMANQYASARSATQAGIQTMTGKYGDAVKSLRQSSGAAQSAADAIAAAAFNPDGSIRNDMAAQKWYDLTMDAAQKQMMESTTAYGASGIDVARRYGWAKAGQSQYAMYGNQRDLSASYERQGEALRGDISRTVTRLTSGIFSGPDEEAQLRSQLIDLMQKERTVRDEGIRALDQANVRLTTFSTGVASAAQRTAFTLGVGGVAGQGYASETFGQFTRRAQAATQATEHIVQQLRGQGMSDEQIQNSEVYQQSLMQQRQAEGDAAEAYVGQGNVPTSVGIRRSLSANQFMYNFLQTFPGTAGNVWSAGHNVLHDIERANAEDEARYNQLKATGQFEGESGQALAETFQTRYQDRMLQYGQVYSAISYDWVNKLQQTVVGGSSTLSYITPSMAMRAAVGAGVRAPLFGSNRQDLPDFMKEALAPGSMAGSFGTSEDFAASAVTGFSGRRGSVGMLPDHFGGGGGGNVTISGELIIRDDGRATIRGKIIDPRQTTRTSAHDTSSSGLAEFNSMIGRGKTW